MNTEMNTHATLAPMGVEVRHSSPAVQYFGGTAKYASSAQYGRRPNVDLACRLVETAFWGGEQFVRAPFPLRSMREDDDVSPQDDGETGVGFIASTAWPNRVTEPNTVFHNPILSVGSLFEAMPFDIGEQSANKVSARAWIDDAHLALIPFHSTLDVAERVVDAPNWRIRSVSLDNMRPLVADRHKTALAEAIEELEDLSEYAAESGLPPPSPNAMQSARRILEKVIHATPLYYSVSPGEDGEVAIQTGSGRENAVLILCDANGGAACYVSVDGENRRAHYDSARNLPDSFVLEALQKLEQGNG